MPNHQYAVFAEGTRHHLHLELTVEPGAVDADLRRALSEVRLASEDHRTNGSVNLVIGVGPDLWARLGPGDSVNAFDPFPGYASPDGDHEAPATQADLWLWLHGPGPDAVLDEARLMVSALDGLATVTLDQPAFVYRDSRDLTGFIDGTANPFLDHAPELATIPPGEPGAGGTFAMTMRFVHDLAAFDALDVDAQEQVIGRTKQDSRSLGAAKPDDAHIVRAEVADDEGEELVVYRRSVPYATATRHGLHFVSFGADQHRFRLQLERMYGLAEDGIVDSLLRYTSADTGSFWLCPSLHDLDVIAPISTDD